MKGILKLPDTISATYREGRANAAASSKNLHKIYISDIVKELNWVSLVSGQIIVRYIWLTLDMMHRDIVGSKLGEKLGDKGRNRELTLTQLVECLNARFVIRQDLHHVT